MTLQNTKKCMEGVSCYCEREKVAKVIQVISCCDDVCCVIYFIPEVDMVKPRLFSWEDFMRLFGKIKSVHLMPEKSSTSYGIPKATLQNYIRNGGQMFVYLGFNVAFNTVQVISRRVVGRAEETST